MSDASTFSGADIQQAARYLAEGRTAVAIELLAELAADFPAYVTAHVLLARAFESAGQLENALRSWHRAYFLMPGSPLITRQRQRLLERVGTVESSAGVFEAAARFPEEPSEDERYEEPADRWHALPVLDDSRAGGDGTDMAASEVSDEPAPDVGAESTRGSEDVQNNIAYEPVDEIGAQHQDPQVGQEAAEARADTVDVQGVDEPAIPGDDPPHAALTGAPPEHEAPEIAPERDTSAHDEGWRLIGEVDRETDAGDPLEAEIAPPGEPPRHDTPPMPASEQDVDRDSIYVRTDTTDLEPPGIDAGDEDDGSDAWDDATSTAASTGDDTSQTHSGDQFLRDASDLDSLIEQLENAPRIPPQYVDAPDVEDGDLLDDAVTETLARIYEGQRQFGAAARAYERLALEHPHRADEFRRRAAELRGRTDT